MVMTPEEMEKDLEDLRKRHNKNINEVMRDVGTLRTELNRLRQDHETLQQEFAALKRSIDKKGILND